MLRFVDEDVRPPLRRWLQGPRPSYAFTRFVLLRLLGVVYYVAFTAGLYQARALVGEHGLLPMKPWLDYAGFLRTPSLLWIAPTDGMLAAICALGMFLSLLVVFGVTNGGVMLALWILQTSLHSVGQLFWGYGWEIQLLETGMLAVFLCPWRTWRPFASAPPEIAIWLFRWLIVRIMLGAGFIKLRGDPCWRELTCLVTHYETQPNPSPLSWALHQMPAWFHTGGVVFNHFVEIVCPLFAFGPRRARHVAGSFMVAFQIVLVLSGNLSFLNWLTIIPAIACFDDTFFRFAKGASVPSPSKALRRAATVYAFVVGILSIGPVFNLLSSRQAMNAGFDPLYLVNTYGAFGSVSKVRDELVIEGSEDGREWKEYELPCKPGDPLRRPCLVTPYHYRLDWQMWFAAMSTYEEEEYWFRPLVARLLRNDPQTLALFASNPFPDRPPRFVRASLYRYAFTRRGQPGWWTRTLIGEWMTPIPRST